MPCYLTPQFSASTVGYTLTTDATCQGSGCKLDHTVTDVSFTATVASAHAAMSVNYVGHSSGSAWSRSVALGGSYEAAIVVASQVSFAPVKNVAFSCF